MFDNKENIQLLDLRVLPSFITNTQQVLITSHLARVTRADQLLLAIQWLPFFAILEPFTNRYEVSSRHVRLVKFWKDPDEFKSALLTALSKQR